MEAAPPSYEKATLIDFWDIVARYMPSNDLCSASLVCSRWHNTFAPHIWGNPASHFGLENDRVYVALTRFKRTLQTARLLVRSMTHTLHLPPAHAEIYNGPQADWLRDVMERLPNLQSLIVRGLPFFDYAALQALVLFRKKPEDQRAPPSGVIELPGSSGSFFQSPATTIPSFGLRLLDASRCPNVTSSGLAAALARFEGLLYLDLSFSYPARDPAVLETLRKFSGLQVLKLRGISLKDESIQVLGKAIGAQVRSLDVRDNQLTDRAVRALLEHCFISNAEASNGHIALASGQRSPTLLPYLGSEMLEIYQGEDFEGYLRSAFTGRFVSRLAIEDAPAGGITHLYIAGNMVTVEGLSGLVRAQRLHVLDIGPVAAARVRHHSFSGGEQESSVTMPGVEKLTPIFAKHAADSMTFLRVDHGLVTREAPQSHPEEVVQGRVELGDTALPYIPAHAAELPANAVRPETFELPADQQTPRFELEADPIKFAISPATDDTYKITTPVEPDHSQEDTYKIVDTGEPSSAKEARRGSALAPEVVESLSNGMQNTLLSPVSAMGEGTMMTMNGFPSPISLDSPGPSPPRTPRPRSYSSIVIERKARVNAHILAGHNLHPAMLSHLSTLVLTGVPSFSQDKEVADRIICFIKNCAEEVSLARKQAELDYSAPPGRKGHATALKHSANKFFGLKRLVLEMAPEGGRRSSKASPWLHQETRSVTEDRDSESLWTAASTDFSFFGEEENMFPTLETGRFAGSGATEKEVNLGYEARAPARFTPAPPPRVDNIALLSSFRKERKLAYQRAVAAGNSDAQIEGLWDGIVQVVRSNNTIRSDEEMDYYGNKYTNNYLYR